MAAAARDLQLAELRDTVRELNSLIKTLQATIEAGAKREEALQLANDNLQEKVDYLTKKLFGTSSEKRTQDIPGQLGLFDEIENTIDELMADDEDEFETQTVTFKKTVKKNKAVLADKIAGLPTREVLIDIPEEERFCDKCGAPLERIGKEYLRTEVEYIPAKVRAVKYYSVTYKCAKCEENFEIPTIVKGKDGKMHMLHGMASASTVAWVMYQKFCNCVPLYRQEKDWIQYGLDVGRQTLANWCNSNAVEFFQPLYDYFHRLLIQREFLMADETPVQVLNEPDRRPQSKSYMWVFHSGEDDGPPLVLYKYSMTRAGENAKDFLDGFKGYLMTDGYSGYNKVKGVIRTSCWAHARRYLVEAIPKGKEYDYSEPAVQGCMYVNKLFAIEKAIQQRTQSPEEIKNLRLQKEKPVLEGLWSWLDLQKPTRGSRFAKAVTYINNRREELENYLQDGRCSFTNNASERSVKPFVMGRKNWLFSATQNGAEASSLIYTMVEMAKANGVNVYHYLSFLLEKCPQADWTDEQLEAVAPWNEAVKKDNELRVINAMSV